MIRQIDAHSIDQITSGQVITSLSSAIKELVENSLDSGASVIEIRLVNHGKDGLSVLDNGHGISPEDFHMIAHKHATSKIEQFSDLGKVTTLGFRGEALASLCALGKVQITTNDGIAASAHQIKFDSSGNLTETLKIAAPVGTLVEVNDLFYQLPVRRKTFERNSQREYGKVVSILQEYALLSNTRFILEHTAKNRKIMALRSQGSQLLQRVVSVYGSKRAKTLDPVNLKSEISGTSGLNYSLTGLISKPAFGMGDQGLTCQLIAVNNRPCQQERIRKTIVEVYKQFNYTEVPFFVLNFEIDPSKYDVNVSPDKRSLLLHDEEQLIDSVRTELLTLFGGTAHSIPVSGHQLPPMKKPRQSLLSFSSYAGAGSMINQRARRDVDNETSEATSRDKAHEEIDANEDDLSENSESDAEVTPKTPEKYVRANTERIASNINFKDTTGLLSYPSENLLNESAKDDVIENESHDETEAVEARREQVASEKRKSQELDNYDNSISTASLSVLDQLVDTTYADAGLGNSTIDNACSHSPSKMHCCGHNGVVSEEQNEFAHGKDNGTDTSIIGGAETQAEGENVVGQDRQDEDKQQFTESDRSTVRIKSHRQRTLNTHIHLPLTVEDIATALNETSKSAEKAFDKLHSFPVDGEDVEERLQLKISKNDFNQMEVVGQFNLGFILVVNRKSRYNDLFVIDQHASDEIYNFERLQQSTVLSRQPLVTPYQLELSAVEELLIQQHLSIFENNGFTIIMKPDHPPGHQCFLESVPFSKSTVFNEKDVLELLGKLKDEPNQPRLRCSKLRAMFAMRACRSSIMIGRPLDIRAMEMVVRHMGTLDKPWNCPHGRPTLRHITTFS